MTFIIRLPGKNSYGRNKDKSFNSHRVTVQILFGDVPDLVRIVVIAPVGRSGQPSLSIVVVTHPVISDSCIYYEVFRKSKADWICVHIAIRSVPWRNIRLCESNY